MYLIFSFNTGGIERLLIDLCNGMVKRDNNVFLCVINNDYTDSLFKYISPSVHIIKLNRAPGNKFQFRYMHELSKLIKRNNIQIVHCQGINCVLFSALSKLCNKNISIINTVHDSGNYSSYSNIKIKAQNMICSKTIAISESVRKEILSRHMNSNNVVTIYNAIDTQKFHYIPRKHTLPLSQCHTIQIGNVARFFPYKKGQDTLIKAIKLLSNKYPAIHCSFAGDIFKGQENEFDKITEYIKSNHLEDKIEFLGNVDDIPSFLGSIDIFVLPSNYEGFGISLIEAMATGLPCIASNLQGPAEIINSPQIGTLFQAGNEIDLANKISKAIDYYENYNYSEISKNICNRFSLGTCISSHLKLYARCINLN